MNYEFSEVEKRLSSESLKTVFKLFYNPEVLKGTIYEHEKFSSGINPNIKHEASGKIMRDFKTFFIDEEQRIRHAIINNRIKGPEVIFSRYIVNNYKGLIKLYECYNTIKEPKEKLHQDTDIEFCEDYTKQFILFYALVNLLIPLRNFMELEFKELLINNGILPSPVQIFNDAISKYKVEVKIHDDNIGLYKPVFVDGPDFFLESRFNNCIIPSVYNNKMNQLYEFFTVYVKSHLKRELPLIDKLEFLLSIETEVNKNFSLFTPLNGKFHVRTDALDNYENELEAINLPDYDDYNIYRLMTIQFESIRSAVNFLNAKIKIINQKIEHEKSVSNSKGLTADFQKIKTTLSVSELAYFIKCLVSAKIIDVPEGKLSTLFRSVSNAFSTKQAQTPTPNSIKNKYDTPTQTAIQQLWQKFGHLKAIADSDK